MIRKAIDSDYTSITEYYREFDQNSVDLFGDIPFSKLYVYEKDRKVVAFINYSIIYDRAEINYIYVDAKYRNEHIASELMDFMLEDCIDNGCTNITLEVAETNVAGIKLYDKYGFEKKAIRKHYYKNCDGLLMMKELVKDGK